MKIQSTNGESNRASHGVSEVHERIDRAAIALPAIYIDPHRPATALIRNVGMLRQMGFSLDEARAIATEIVNENM